MGRWRASAGGAMTRLITPPAAIDVTLGPGGAPESISGALSGSIDPIARWKVEMPALAITDTGGVYGAVRHLQACRKLGVKPIIGSALEVDGEELILIARNLRGYSNLCRLLTLAHADQPKGEARTALATVAEHRGDLFYLSATDIESRLRGLQDALGKENVFSELHQHLRPEDEWVLEGRVAMAERCGARVVATNEVHYHIPARRRLPA